MQASSTLVRALAGYPLALAALGALGCEARLAVSEPLAGDDAGVHDGSGGSSTSVPASCSDGVKSGDESDIDCGGSCAACAAEFSCARHDDCDSKSCRAGLCVAAACDDGRLNGDEAGVDCGGSCNRCRTNTCNCASSPTLSAISCDETLGTVQYSVVNAVTPDGRTALVFASYDVPDVGTVWRTLRWTADGELTLLGDGLGLGISTDGRYALLRTINGSVSFVDGTEPAITVPLQPDAVLSADGSQIIGTTLDTDSDLARWTPSGGLEVIADLPPGSWSVTALTPDAATVVGYGYSGNAQVPFRWTAAGGLSDLGALPENADGVRPLAISHDGSVIAGATFQEGRERDLFRWTEEAGISVIGPALYIAYGVVMFLSADGSVVVGESPDPTNGFRWTATDGAVSLLDTWSSAKDMSPDGTMVLGQGTYSGFLWTPTKVTDFSELLSERNVDLTGWSLGEPHKMTPDGSVVFGRGTCGGVEVTYRLELAD